MPKISVVIPVYNEEGAVSDTLDSVFKVIKSIKDYEFEVIVVDDASQDGTVKILEERTDIKLLRNPYNLGYGGSLKRGIRVSTGDWIFITDADGTYPVGQMKDFLPYLKNYDMVVGARGDREPILKKRFAKKVLNSIAGWLSDYDIQDINSGMRIFRRDLCMEFWNLYPQKFSFTSTITMAFIKSGYFIKYVPIEYHKRKGSSSIVPTDFFRFMNLIFKIAFYFNPLRFLTPISWTFFLTGFIKGSYDLVTLNSVGNFSIFLMIFGGMIYLLAILADLILRQRR